MNQIHLTDPTAEEHLIGACLESATSLMSVVGSGLKPEDFNGPGNEIIFRTMKTMMDKGESIDATTVAAKLEAGGKLELIGGQGVLDRITGCKYITHNASAYADIIRDRSIRRELFDVSQEINNRLHNVEDIRALIGGAENLIYRVADKLTIGGTRGMKAEDLVRLYSSRREQVERIPYPVLGLNHATGGRERGCFTVWGGYSGDGKTILGMQSALAAAEHGYSVGFFSLEMTEEELLYRLLAMVSGVKMKTIKSGVMSLEQSAEVDKAVDYIKKLDLTTYHDPSYTPDEIRSVQMREKHDLIVVDYLQRFYFTDWKDLANHTKSLRNLALSTSCCVDLLSQLKMDDSYRGNNPCPVPDVSRFFGGKQPTFDANNIIFLHHFRVQDEDGKWQPTGRGELIIDKQRGGDGHARPIPVVRNSTRIMWEEQHEGMSAVQEKD